MFVPYLQRYGPFKNRPSVGGSRGGASLFTEKHEVRATLSSVDLNKVTSFFTHETAEYTLSIKISKGLPRYPSPQKSAFFLPVDNLITASEKI